MFPCRSEALPPDFPSGSLAPIGRTAVPLRANLDETLPIPAVQSKAARGLDNVDPIPIRSSPARIGTLKDSPAVPAPAARGSTASTPRTAALIRASSVVSYAAGDRTTRTSRSGPGGGDALAIRVRRVRRRPPSATAAARKTD